MKNIKFKFEGGILLGYLLNGPSTIDIWNIGLLYSLFDKGENDACVQVIIKINTLSIAVWKRQAAFQYSREALIDLMELVIPHIVIPRTISEVKDAYKVNKPFTIIFSSNHDKFTPDTYTLEINSCNSIDSFVEKIVYNSEYSNKLVRNEILKYLYYEWEEADEKSVPIDKILRKLFIPMTWLERNLKLLAQQGKINRYVNKDGTTISSYLLEKGVSYVENDFQEITTGNQFIYNMADTAGRDINKIYSNGNNANNIINTGSMTLDKAFSELKEKIEKEYIGEDKNELLKEVETIEKETTENPDKKSIIQKILSLAGKFAMNPTIMNIITTKIVPLLQESIKHIKI